MSNGTIESLSCRRIFNSNNFDTDEFCGLKLMMTCEVLPNLKHLKLGKNSKLKMSCIENIVEMCKNLESSIDVIGNKIEVGMIPMRNGFKLCCHDLSSERYVFSIHELI